jgi:DnaK suppressor protein
MGSYDRERVERLLRERSKELRRAREPGRLESDPPRDEVDAGWEQLIADEEQRVEAARKALEEGSYGTCADCRAPIPPSRLEAVPDAARCIECQRRHEAR